MQLHTTPRDPSALPKEQLSLKLDHMGAPSIRS